jgi:hypothetical protein
VRHDGPPPEEAYGRVTNPERYRVLHTVARQMLDDLVSSFRVERHDSLTADPSGCAVQAPATRLVPISSDAGALTVVFTGFPGLLVHLGQWRQLALPACGCDACDEDPEELAENLHDEVSALVGGRYEERLTHGHQRTVSFGWTTGAGRRSSGGRRLSRSEVESFGPARDIGWAPWPSRGTQR